jgi:hypothetical protein
VTQRCRSHVVLTVSATDESDNPLMTSCAGHDKEHITHSRDLVTRLRTDLPPERSATIFCSPLVASFFGGAMGLPFLGTIP